MKFTIYGEPRTKKNSSRIVKIGSYHKIIPSKQYLAYEKDFVQQAINMRVNKKIAYKANIACIYYMKTRRKVDLTNLLSGTMDCLVSSGVIEDDNCTIAYSHDGSYVDYDKNNPRVEIEIREI